MVQGQGTQVPLEAQDWQVAIAELVAEGAAPLRARSGGSQVHDTPVRFASQQAELKWGKCCSRSWVRVDCWSTVVRMCFSGNKGGREYRGGVDSVSLVADGRKLGLGLQAAQAVIEQVAANPCLLNLSRTLAFHKRTWEEEPLTLAEAEHHQHLVHDLSDTLRTILCL